MKTKKIRTENQTMEGASLHNNLFPCPGTNTLRGRCALVRVPFGLTRWNVNLKPLPRLEALEARVLGAFAD
ncbi:hypothetical protein V9K67_21910 [Paraflavisolibacter sp. H34]|uniref:hypothetical protein n=1 Tax=Huijunlia imazamoxiresistens TaxID=3127457 RepID=UPI003017EAD0